MKTESQTGLSFDAYRNYQQNAPYSVEVENQENTYRQLTQEEFINKIKTDGEFAKQWGDFHYNETSSTMQEMNEVTPTTSNIILDDYITIKTPNYVGGYRLGGELGFQVNFTYKPNWFRRTMMKLCFGWEWVNL
jgi:hypothetical protein